MNELTSMPNRFGHRAVPQARILNLILFETGEYQQQWRRPYSTDLSGNMTTRFQEQLQGLQHYSPANMGGIAQGFLMPVTKVEGQVGIAGGSWGQRRCRFMMLVEYDNHMGSKMQEILTGYTTHVGAQQAGVIRDGTPGLLTVEDNLQFIVNSTIKLQRAEEWGPRGHIQHTAIASNTHVFADNRFSSMYQPQIEERMRPNDIFSAIQSGPMQAVANSQPGGRGVFDTRTAQSTLPVLSKRSNVIPTNHVARVFESYSNAREQAIHDPTKNGGDFYGTARGLVNDGLVSEDEVLRMLGEFRGEGASNTFTFRDLLRLDPTINGRVHGRVSGMTVESRLNNLHTPNQSSEWNGRDGYDVLATIISQCVPGMMSDLGLTRLCFETDNMFARNPDQRMGTPDQMPFFIPSNLRSISGQSGTDRDLSAAAWKFEHRFWTDLMQGLCYNNQIPYSLTVNCDLYGETVVNLSFDNKPMVQYVTPSFADALLTPLVTSNPQHLQAVADDFNTLITSVIKKDDPGIYGFVPDSEKVDW